MSVSQLSAAGNYIYYYKLFLTCTVLTSSCQPMEIIFLSFPMIRRTLVLPLINHRAIISFSLIHLQALILLQS